MVQDDKVLSQSGWHWVQGQNETGLDELEVNQAVRQETPLDNPEQSEYPVYSCACLSSR
ncbi:hypothetical protein HanRHA438_Chr16g0744961 [Helianthus annuus]|nr:hypothetical protein HanRHA438_Chr16g0744961 [Helianthus annuus]